MNVGRIYGLEISQMRTYMYIIMRLELNTQSFYHTSAHDMISWKMQKDLTAKRVKRVSVFPLIVM